MLREAMTSLWVINVMPTFYTKKRKARKFLIEVSEQGGLFCECQNASIDGLVIAFIWLR
jgi:hypothetical protein